jgi:hypothetical protein
LNIGNARATALVAVVAFSGGKETFLFGKAFFHVDRRCAAIKN